MKKKFILEYEFMHCKGSTRYSCGSADTQEEAEKWARKMNSLKPPADSDTRCECPAAECPMKHSNPVYTYTEINETPENQ